MIQSCTLAKGQVVNIFIETHIVVPRWKECTQAKNGDSCFDMSTLTPSYVSRVTRRRTSHVDASSGPGLGQLDTAAAAKEISSSVVTTGGGEGGEADSELLAGGGGAGGADVVVVDTSAVSGGDFVFVSPPAAANGGSGGGAGVSHLVWKIGKKIDWMVMIK